VTVNAGAAGDVYDVPGLEGVTMSGSTTSAVPGATARESGGKVEVFVLPWRQGHGLAPVAQAGGATVERETGRALDWLVRRALPAWLDAAWCPAAAVALRSVDELDGDVAAASTMHTLAVTWPTAWKAVGARAGLRWRPRR
jgi:hypothetical protein